MAHNVGDRPGQHRWPRSGHFGNCWWCLPTWRIPIAAMRWKFLLRHWDPAHHGGADVNTTCSLGCADVHTLSMYCQPADAAAGSLNHNCVTEHLSVVPSNAPLLLISATQRTRAGQPECWCGAARSLTTRCQEKPNTDAVLGGVTLRLTAPAPIMRGWSIVAASIDAACLVSVGRDAGVGLPLHSGNAAGLYAAATNAAAPGGKSHQCMRGCSTAEAGRHAAC
jgi:hypothetical protein